MHRHTASSEHCQCPFVDRDDPRCNSRFGLTRLAQAFSVCFGSFRGCPMYHRLRTGIEPERTAPAVAALVPVIVTRHGKPLELRPTGT